MKKKAAGGEREAFRTSVEVLPPREPKRAQRPFFCAESAMKRCPARSAQVCKRSEPRERGWPRASPLSPRKSGHAPVRPLVDMAMRLAHRLPSLCLRSPSLSASPFLLLSHLAVVVLVAREHAGGEPRGGRSRSEPGERERGGRFRDRPCRRRR